MKVSHLIKVDNLDWQVDRKSVLSGVSFTLSKGETVGVVGPNGAGKTSLLKCLYGEHRNFAGNISLTGKPITQLSRNQLAKTIAVVAQTNVSIFNLSVYDVVRMGLLPHKALFESDTEADINLINRALQQVDLLDKQHQAYATLSGGEQQRTLIARAIVQQSPILIMDEPTNHLDIYYQHQLIGLAKNTGRTLLLAIHDLNLAAQYCDRLILLNQGQVVADDTPNNVLTAKRLKQVFRLDCIVDQNPHLACPRVTFAPNKINDRQMTGAKHG
ncbi:ABC transporter ATP-binding protein [Saccharobesus litoralis]|uniref:ABC transporter ATP-binding protein n=1 Tax=Saccharobesus litoralis TaxID=2172099 RepID=A0A2S0VM69_9ALTE|nr:ABC transporter ATP-binding protein [Saccharobesus litoralis]AWB65210.1 ABC transporter ATP-binding protein [Saccharobesus litoralis]